MNSNILFLKMLKSDIRRSVSDNKEIPSNGNNYNSLAGHKILKSKIMSLPSYKLMNDDERQMFENILSELKTSKSGEKGFTKRYDSLIPRSNESEYSTEYMGTN